MSEFESAKIDQVNFIDNIALPFGGTYNFAQTCRGKDTSAYVDEIEFTQHGVLLRRFHPLARTKLVPWSQVKTITYAAQSPEAEKVEAKKKEKP